MPSEEMKTQLSNLIPTIMEFDEEKLLRKEYGSLSIEKDFEPLIKELQNKFSYLIQYSRIIHNDHLQPIISELEAIQGEMEQQANHSSQEDYVANRTAFLDNMKSHLERIRRHWPLVVATIMDARGLLEDEGARQTYQDAIESIKTESEDALERVKEQADKIIEDARAAGAEIEHRARLTATGTSVEDAQKQFNEAQVALERRVWFWGLMGAIFVLVFFAVALYFAKADLPDQWRWQLIYHSSIRVSILTAIGTIAAFCLKILRAQLHMSEKNRHRQRVANSMEAFIQSAATPEQRDLILGQLVESIVQFGNSGLVQREDDQMYRPKMMIDTITRPFTPGPQKES